MVVQPSLFDAPPEPADGFAYEAGFIAADEERALVAQLEALAFKPFEFRGYLGNRRTVSFGWRYDFNERSLAEAAALPTWLGPLRRRAEGFAGLAEGAFVHALLTEYAPGAGIGWHRDRPEFETVVGVSLLAPCRFRLRRRAGKGFERREFTAEPRSAYRLAGDVREAWEHSIPPLDALRYSITFRSLRETARGR